MSPEAPSGVWGGMICDLLVMIYELPYAISFALLLTCVSQVIIASPLNPLKGTLKRIEFDLWTQKKPYFLFSTLVEMEHRRI